MIDYQEALVIMDRYLKALEKDTLVIRNQPEIELILIESSTLEKPFGWIFFYNSRQFVEEGNLSYALAGNAPVIVDRLTGKLTETGTARSVEYYAELYERQGYL